VKKREAWPLLLLLFATSRAAARRGLSLAELRALAARNGFPDPRLAAAVAMAESGGNRFAVGDNASSFGLWQIHTPAHPQFSPAELFDADNNARAAFSISKGGTDWSPWSTFRDGLHLRFLGGSP
jgi:hypothetical protein